MGQIEAAFASEFRLKATLRQAELINFFFRNDPAYPVNLTPEVEFKWQPG